MGTFDGVELANLAITSARLTLRPWRGQDAAGVHRAMQDRSLHEFLPLPDPYEPADAAEFVTRIAPALAERGAGIECAVVESGSGRLAGSAALRLPEPRHVSAEIGYAIYPDARGHGYAAEATRALADWALAHGVQRVEIISAVANLASVKTALNAGFRFEAVHRRDVLTPAGPVDGAVFARLAGDSGEPVAPVVAPLPPAGLTDGTVALRPLLPGDLDGVTEQEDDPLTRSWEFTNAPRHRDGLRTMCESARLHWLVGPVLHCAIVDAASAAFAGTITVRLMGPPQVGGVGYVVHPRFRGRGYTARALRLLRSWAFEQAGLARLELGAKEDNVASQKAALAGGFVPDGVREARLRNPDGTFSDEVRFAAVNPSIRPSSDG